MKRNRRELAILFALLFSFSSFCAFASEAGTRIESAYKQTADLSRADKYDPYQKNYQKDQTSTDAAYLYKTAEWTDKENGEAKVTVTAHFTGDLPPKTRAVYAMTICTAHQFTKAKAIENINFLLENYDYVDIVLAAGHTPSGIVILEDVKSADFLDDYSFKSNEHWNLMLYEGLYDYLMKVVPGKETGGEEEKQQRFPDFIYTSFDSRIVQYKGAAGNGDAKLDNYDLGSILQQYDNEGRYCSLTGCGRGDTKELSLYNNRLDRSNEILKINCIACLMDPQSWQGLEQSKLTLWDKTTKLILDTKVSCHSGDDHVINPLNGHILTSDYAYKDTFQANHVPTVIDIRISDTVDERFEITDYQFSSPSGIVTRSGNTVNVSLSSIEAEPMVLTINIKAKESAGAGFLENWKATNTKEATAVLYKNNKLSKMLAVASPILCNPREPVPPGTGDRAPVLVLCLLLCMSGISGSATLKRKRK